MVELQMYLNEHAENLNVIVRIIILFIVPVGFSYIAHIISMRIEAMKYKKAYRRYLIEEQNNFIKKMIWD